MAGASSAFRLGDGVMDRWKIFRRKSADAVAMVLKIDADNEQVVLDFDGEFQQMPPEDLQDEMSDSSPRWILWLFKHERDDGRTQYPLLLVYFSPLSCNAKSKMLYASCTPFIAQTLEIAKVHELQDLEEMTLDKLQSLHASSVTR
mmetsp:Transcript_64665/g.94726  ORF Transcript_64665/g.94726 Transcript_64665/m.94726 type:complete len:146 (+) Transcript_64665:91-528(+)